VHHITLPILDERGTRVESHEVLEVEHESDGTVRLTHSPAFVAGIARGDLIALDAAAWSGFRILERGGMLAAVVSFSAVEQRQEAEPSLSDEVRSLGGMCEGGPGRRAGLQHSGQRGLFERRGVSEQRVPALSRSRLVLRKRLGPGRAALELVARAGMTRRNRPTPTLRSTGVLDC
jgi:Domain of unknown function (DUF4265)